MDVLMIRRVQSADKPEWLRMRNLLWPDHTEAEMLEEMDEILADETAPVFVAVRPDGRLGGFLEGGLRKYADGCDTSPVGYIEGWYVDEDLRRSGVGGQLVQAMEAWTRERGLTEMGSDTWLDNETSITAHTRLGYVEMERLVHFAKKL
jgi:aminoglycoside 6'-N-acetyltransferase I